MLHLFHKPWETQVWSTVVLPLCLARYLPRTMIKHKVTKTTTATTPPIKAWSVPCCPTALGSEERQTEKQRQQMKAPLGEVRPEEQQKTDNTQKSKEEIGLFLGRSCSNELLSFPSPFTSCSQSRGVWLSENNKMRERDGHHIDTMNRQIHIHPAKWGRKRMKRDSEKRSK